jgi:hypothetical protein
MQGLRPTVSPQVRSSNLDDFEKAVFTLTFCGATQFAYPLTITQAVEDCPVPESMEVPRKSSKNMAASLVGGGSV